MITLPRPAPPAFLQDNIRTALRKLQDAETQLEKRLADVESRVEGKVHARVAEAFLPGIEKRLASAGGAWRIPFVVLLIVIVALCVMALLKYRKLLKTHLL